LSKFICIGSKEAFTWNSSRTSVLIFLTLSLKHFSAENVLTCMYAAE
jgi:hypothetical protein